MTWKVFILPWFKFRDITPNPHPLQGLGKFASLVYYRIMHTFQCLIQGVDRHWLMRPASRPFMEHHGALWSRHSGQMEGMSVHFDHMSTRLPLKSSDMSLTGFKWQPAAEHSTPLNRTCGWPIMGLCVCMPPCGVQRMKEAAPLIAMLVDMCTLWLWECSHLLGEVWVNNARILLNTLYWLATLPKWWRRTALSKMMSCTH